MLAGCGGSGITDLNNAAAALPPIPEDIKRCISEIVPRPDRIKTKAQVVKLIGDLKRSERRKTRCGRRLIQLYERHKALLASV